MGDELRYMIVNFIWFATGGASMKAGGNGRISLPSNMLLVLRHVKNQAGGIDPYRLHWFVFFPLYFGDHGFTVTNSCCCYFHFQEYKSRMEWKGWPDG